MKKSLFQMFQECSKQSSSNAGKEAHAHMITSGIIPIVFVTNCLIQMYVKLSNMNYAHELFDRMPQRDTVSRNTMIYGYVSRGLISTAQSIFDAMPEKDVFSWNSLISGYLQDGNCYKSVDLFLQMGQTGMKPDRTTFAVILKSCSALEDYELGIQIHGFVIQMGFDSDVVMGSALVDMYAKFKSLGDSHRLFNEMPERNLVSWSAIIACFVQNDRLIDRLELFKEMQRAGVGVTQSTYASVFRSCASLPSLKLGRQIHGHAVKSYFGSDRIVGTAVLDMYSKCDLDVHPNYNFGPLKIAVYI